MQLKTYRAARMGAAMALIRAELGQDALILGTRRVDGGVEITAAADPDADAANGARAAARAAPVEDPSHARTAPALVIASRPPKGGREAPRAFQPPVQRLGLLRGHGVPDALTERLMAGPLTEALTETLAAALPFGALDFAAPLLLCGPPGAGKTLTVAKLATRLVLAGGKPCVITTDAVRPAASEQLAAYTRLLGLRLMVAHTPEALARGIARAAPGAPVLIDSAGTGPDDRGSLSALLAAAGAQACAVLPAGMDAADAAEIAQRLHALGARTLIATRTDISRRLGGILAAAAAGLALTEAGVSADAASGLVAATPDFIAGRLARGVAQEHP